MGVVAVDTAVGYKAEHMKGSAVLFAVFNCGKEFRHLEKVTVLDGLGNPGQFLVYNAACPHVKMAHLRVAHLSFRKSYCHSAGLALYKGALAHKLVHDRGPALAHSIVVAIAVKAIAVKYH